MDYPCALNLTLKPEIYGISIIPFVVPLSVGFKRTYFRVSVPMNWPDGEFYINWVTEKELSPPLYTPIKDTKIVVTRNKSKFLNSIS